jgi:hypothetical protein
MSGGNEQHIGQTTTPWYTDQEVDDICDGLVNNAAKVRHLRAQGLTVTTKPNGRPLVMRAHAESVLSGLRQIDTLPTNTTPVHTNRAALVALFGKQRAAA